MSVTYRSVFCEPCDESFQFQGAALEGHREPDEDIRCLHCKGVLGQMRADLYPPALVGCRTGKHDFLEGEFDD